MQELSRSPLRLFADPYYMQLKKFLIGASLFLGAFLSGATVASAVTILPVQQGGTGWGYPGNITLGAVLFGGDNVKLATSTNFTFSTTTNTLSVLNFNVSGTCTGCGSSYPFPLAGNATSTLTQFNGGLTAVASSTIGAGGVTTGLTIFGDATTTGTLHFTGGGNITGSTGDLTFASAGTNQGMTFTSTGTGIITFNTTPTNFNVGTAFNNNSAVQTPNVANFLAPNASTGGAGTGAFFTIGVANSTQNSGAIQFTNIGTGSNSNFMGFGINGTASLLNVFKAGVGIGTGTTVPPSNSLIVAGNIGISQTNPTASLQIGAQGISQATISSIVSTELQSQTTNARTLFSIVPNGASTNADLWLFNKNDPANASRFGIGYNSSFTQWTFFTDKAGTGTAAPLSFQSFNGANAGAVALTQLVLPFAGGIGVGLTSPGTAVEIATSSINSGFHGGQLTLNDTNGGVNLKNWVFGSAGGNLYISTSTDAFATSTTQAFSISNFGTTTLMGLNISAFATSTSNVGFNITGGCYAVNGSCVGGSGGGGTVSQVNTTYPVIGGPFTTTGTIALDFGTTTSNLWGGTQTFTNSPIFSVLGAGTVNSTSAGTIYNTATSSLSVGSPLTVTGTLGALIGGTNATINCQAASGSQAGCLSSADWTTFNNKSGFAYPFLTATNFGSTTAATSTPIWGQGGLFASTTSTLPGLAVSQSGTGPAALFDGGNVGIGTSSPWALLSLNAPATPNAYFAIGSSTSQVASISPSQNPFLGIGTSSPFATISAVSDGTHAIFALATSTTAGSSNPVFQVDVVGHIISSGPPPSSANANCSGVAGNDNNFRVNTATSQTTCTINFVNTWANAPICVANEETAGVVVAEASSTPSTVVLTFASALTTKSIAVICRGYI